MGVLAQLAQLAGQATAPHLVQPDLLSVLCGRPGATPSAVPTYEAAGPGAVVTIATPPAPWVVKLTKR